MRPISLFALLVVLITAESRAQVNVSGTLLGADGQPMALSHLVIEDGPTDDTTVVVPVDALGSFAFTLHRPGGYGMYAVGVHHQTLEVPLILTSHEDVSLHIELAADSFATAIDAARLISPAVEDTIDMVRRPDGTFAVSVTATADTFAYRISGVRYTDYGWDYTSVGTNQDRYAFNQRGPFWDRIDDYLSVLDAEEGEMVEVVLDPAAFPRTLSQAAIHSEPSFVAKIANIYLDVEQRGRRIDKATDGNWFAAAIRFFRTLRRESAAVREQIRREENMLVRHWLILRYFDEISHGYGRDSRRLAREALQALPPDSPLWSYEAWSRTGASNIMWTMHKAAKAPELWKAYIKKVVEAHSDPDVRAQFLSVGIYRAHDEGDEQKMWRYYHRLQAEHPGTFQAERTFRDFDSARIMQPGNPIPEYSFASLDNPGTTISSDSLLGRPYLIDFWGTWCAPCIKAMPSLEKTYERYSESGFEILSIALLDTPEDIQEFREDRFPMPWLHTLVEREDDPSVRATFEITGIPRPILVSSEGIILAIDEELDDDNLLDAVEAALSEDN